MNKLKEIKQMPTTHNMVHESIYKSHATLQLVKDMLKRGDSNESILMVIEEIYDKPLEWSINVDARKIDEITKDRLRDAELQDKANELKKQLKEKKEH